MNTIPDTKYFPLSVMAGKNNFSPGEREREKERKGEERHVLVCVNNA